MPTIRGFVEGLEIGRAGLLVATVVQDDGTRGTYRIADLDADPERFNERLSKLGLLRDAMDAAEPVEIEFTSEGSANLIERVRRITRDSLEPVTATDRVTGMVIGVAVAARNLTGAASEAADRAVVGLMAAGSAQSYVLDLQAPERGVAEAQLDLLREAQAAGDTVTLDVAVKERRIVSVTRGELGGAGDGGDKGEPIAGFVEAIAHSQLAQSHVMLVRLVTAPPFETAAGGHFVKLEPFTPSEIALAVLRGSPEHALLEAALRDKLRVHVLGSAAADSDRPNEPRDEPRDDNEPMSHVPLAADGGVIGVVDGAAGHARPLRLVRGVELLHALASASRPVWIEVRRRSLDVGPEVPCAPGLPSNDLTPRTLRDLALPYKAEWSAIGCFNHGVYRFQFILDTPFELYIDGELRCLHAAEDGSAQFAHACLDGDHEVRVVLPEWTCRKDFAFDVYRIR